jgi:hypothetical protein
MRGCFGSYNEQIETRFSSGFAEDAQNSPHTVLRILG